MASTIVSPTRENSIRDIRELQAQSMRAGSEPVATQERLPLFRKRKRFVDRRTGRLGVKRKGRVRMCRSYLATGYHGLIDLPWVLFLGALVSIYLLTFLTFGLVYWYLSTVDECIEHVTTFAESFFFAVQTGMTIGYGVMYPKGCTAIIWAVTFHSLWTLITDAMLMGLAFHKLARPEPAAKAFIFSENAVVCKRDGKKVLIFRLGWLKPTQLIESHVRLYLSVHRVTEEGESLHYFTELMTQEFNFNFIYLALPHDIVHEIDETSPLHGVDSAEMQSRGMELIVVVEGISAFTSDTVATQFSYLASDIYWDKRFVPIVTRLPDFSYTVDFDKFSDVEDEATAVTSLSHIQ